MSTRAYQFDGLTNTPLQIAAGAAGQVQTIEAYNSNATAAYVKLYMGPDTPTGSSIPVWSGLVGQGARSLPPFLDGALWWIAVATEHRAGLSAPAAAFNVEVSFEPAGF